MSVPRTDVTAGDVPFELHGVHLDHMIVLWFVLSLRLLIQL